MWKLLVLDASWGTPQPFNLHEKAKLWLSIPSVPDFQILLDYGERPDLILPMISYLMPASTWWDSVNLHETTKRGQPCLWFENGNSDVWNMQLAIGPRSFRQSLDSFTMGNRHWSCCEGYQHRTVQLATRTNSILTKAVQPFAHVRSLSLMNDADGAEESSCCQRTIEILALFPALESLHIFNKSNSSALVPHDHFRIKTFPRLVHLCVELDIPCILSHLRAPNLKHLFLGHGGSNLGTLLRELVSIACYPPLKTLNIGQLTSSECIWIAENIPSLAELHLTDDSQVSNEFLQLLTPALGRPCRLPLLSSLRLKDVTEKFAPRTLCDMVRSRVVASQAPAGNIRRIEQLVLTRKWGSRPWSEKPEWDELKEMVGRGLKELWNELREAKRAQKPFLDKLDDIMGWKVGWLTRA